MFVVVLTHYRTAHVGAKITEDNNVVHRARVILRQLAQLYKKVVVVFKWEIEIYGSAVQQICGIGNF